jgi:lyso-ornithine lipid O-acyltransferase
VSDWNPEDTPDKSPLGLSGWIIAMVRLVAMATVIYGLMVVLALTLLLEIPFRSRPVSPYIVQIACKMSLAILGIKVNVHGRPMHHKGAIVSNHASWLDIFPLNAAAQVFFVSKAEVRKWPVIGLMARAAGTVFIERRTSQAKRHKSQFESRLIKGDRLLFFPEGTSTDSLRVMKFKSSLFAAFFEPSLVDIMWIQSASLIYHAPKGEDARYYGWWGDMPFGANFLKILGAKRTGSVDVVFHDPVRVLDFGDRKALAQHCEAQVRAGFEKEAAQS